MYKVQKITTEEQMTTPLADIYALKLIKLSEFDEKEKENILNEIRILASISHPNIIQYVEAFVIAKTEHLW